MSKRQRKKAYAAIRRAVKRAKGGTDAPREATAEESEPDYSRKCNCCGASPVVPVTGMCGPCTWGEADTLGGNW